MFKCEKEALKIIIVRCATRLLLVIDIDLMKLLFVEFLALMTKSGCNFIKYHNRT